MPNEAIPRTRLCRAATTVGYLGGEGGTVANWRRKALALFCDLRHDVQRPDFSVYMLFFELLPKARRTQQGRRRRERIRRIYGFAEWCLEQKAKDMWNAAGVALFRHPLRRPSFPVAGGGRMALASGHQGRTGAVGMAALC